MPPWRISTGLPCIYMTAPQWTHPLPLTEAACAHIIHIYLKLPTPEKLFYARPSRNGPSNKNYGWTAQAQSKSRSAEAAGVARERILVHGVNKSMADLSSAIQHAGTIVVDNLTELNRIASFIVGIQPERIPSIIAQRIIPEHLASPATRISC